MKKFALLSAGLAAMIVPLLPAVPAQAQNTKSFVSSTGSGTLCTRAAPCNNFLDAHAATDPGGEINCLDSGPFLVGTSITKSITIDCAGTAATAGGFNVNGAGIVVKIRNLKIDGLLGSTLGINFVNGAALLVENCVIQNYTGGTAIGIKFAPSAGAQLVVTDTTINNNGTGLTGGGIIIQPTGSGTRDIVLDRVRVENNVTGIRVDGSGSTGVIQTTVRDSVVSGNKTGSGVTAVTTAGGAVTTAFIDRTALVSNGTGALSNGAQAVVLLSASTIQANGVALSSAAGGALFSYKDNKINNNGTPGAAPTVVAQN